VTPAAAVAPAPAAYKPQPHMQAAPQPVAAPAAKPASAKKAAVDLGI
jgi:hypothetical protein